MIGVATIQSGTRSALGIALCMVAVLAYAAAVVVQKSVLTRVSPFQVTWLGCVAGTIACLPFAPTLVADAAKAGPAALGWTIYLGVVPTALGFATWAFALRRGTAGSTATLNYLIPVVAIMLGWAVLSRTTTMARHGRRSTLPGWRLSRPPANRQRKAHGVMYLSRA